MSNNLQLKSELNQVASKLLTKLKSLCEATTVELSSLTDSAKLIESVIRDSASADNIKTKQAYDILLQNPDMSNLSPKMTLDVKLTDVEKMTKENLLGTVKGSQEEQHGTTVGKDQAGGKATKGMPGGGQSPKGTPAGGQSPKGTPAGGQSPKGMPKVTVKNWKHNHTGVAIRECATDGSYIELYCTHGFGPHTLPGMNICGWRIERTVNSQPEVDFTLPEFTMWPRQTRKLFARGQKTVSGGSYDDIECGVPSWGSGDKTFTLLHNREGTSKVAAYTQTTEYS